MSQCEADTFDVCEIVKQILVEGFCGPGYDFESDNESDNIISTSHRGSYSDPETIQSESSGSGICNSTVIDALEAGTQ